MDLMLYSERLVLAPISTSDLALVVSLFTDPKVMKYAEGPSDPQDIEKQMSDCVRRGGNGCIGIWTVSDRTTLEKMGTVALLPMPVDEKETDFECVIPGVIPDGDIEIGYYFKPSFWGHGYATEACKCLLDKVFESSSLTEVAATFDPANEDSRRVLTKTGFQDYGTRRRYGVCGPYYKITRQHWKHNKGV